MQLPPCPSCRCSSGHCSCSVVPVWPSSTSSLTHLLKLGCLCVCLEKLILLVLLGSGSQRQPRVGMLFWALTGGLHSAHLILCCAPTQALWPTVSGCAGRCCPWWREVAVSMWNTPFLVHIGASAGWLEHGVHVVCCT